jgi:tRNA nucleotidyltransferase/poly(A) polymerase
MPSTMTNAEMTPRQPHRPLLWSDVVFDVAEWVATAPNPVYIVGGAVRDALLHRPLQDLDLATGTNAAELARRIANHLNGDFFVLDSERDVGRALVATPQGRMTIDVARFRGDTLANDLRDRDFTLNAMAVDLQGDLNLLIDPLNGERDIHDKIVRRCAPGVIDRDPIRVLRAVRQSVQLAFRIEAETLRELRNAVPHLTNVSPERIRDEFIKMLALSRSAAALRIADTLGVLSVIVPEVDLLREGSRDSWARTLHIIEILSTLLTSITPARTDNTAATFGLGVFVMQADRYRARLLEHIAFEWPNERPHRALLVLALLLYACGEAITAQMSDRGKQVTRLAEERALGLRLSNSERERMVAVMRHIPWVLGGEVLTPVALHHFWSEAKAAGVDAVLLAVVDYLGNPIDQDSWLKVVERARVLLEAYYDRYEQIVEPPLLLDGAQLMSALDLKPGPMIGRLLQQIREAQVTGDVRTTEDALNVARTFVAQNR